jgi:Domain of unknown function (DUF4251)
MKIRSYPGRSLLLGLALFSVTASLHAQAAKNDFGSKISGKHFVFKAQTVTPTSGRLRQLTSDYDVKVSGDSLIVYLPYFGRAYSAPINSTDVGINFTSVNFDYNASPRKKKGWDLVIKPKDASGVQDLSFTIFDNGSASLRVNSVNRQPISFNGYLVK